MHAFVQLRPLEGPWNTAGHDKQATHTTLQESNMLIPLCCVNRPTVASSACVDVGLLRSGKARFGCCAAAELCLG